MVRVQLVHRVEGRQHRSSDGSQAVEKTDMIGMGMGRQNLYAAPGAPEFAECTEQRLTTREKVEAHIDH